MTKTEFKKLANDLRRATPSKRVFLANEVNGCTVNYKAFGTWVQVFSIDGPGRAVRDGDVSDRTVKQYGEFVDSMLALIPGE